MFYSFVIVYKHFITQYITGLTLHWNTFPTVQEQQDLRYREKTFTVKQPQGGTKV